MSKILLAAVNACYNHTNLAVRSISHYVNKTDLVNWKEWTINQNIHEILRGIGDERPDVILFSVYIWNAEIIQKLIYDIKKIMPNCAVGAGGSEVSFYAEGYLNKLISLDFVIRGEGEQTVKEIASAYEKKFCLVNNASDVANTQFNADDFLQSLKTIAELLHLKTSVNR